MCEMRPQVQLHTIYKRNVENLALYHFRGRAQGNFYSNLVSGLRNRVEWKYIKYAKKNGKNEENP